MTATTAPDTFYGQGFAEFYDRYGTGWTRQFAPVLAGWLPRHVPAVGGRVLDLACGTGVATEVLHRAGWPVLGLDLSAGMLAAARTRLAAATATGAVRLERADAAAFQVDEPLAAAVALEGALNHLASLAALEQCLGRVAAALRPGAPFVFDLYEPHHFRGWHRISVVDEPDAVVVKRGVWDDDAAVGMLRISGIVDGGAGPLRVDQTVTSRAWPVEVVHERLRAAGLQPGRFDAEVPPCQCGRSDTGSCRTVYAAVRAGGAS